MKLRVCPTCSKEFRVFEYLYKNGRSLYCCRACKMMQECTYVSCGVCEKIFRVTFSLIKNNRGKYCSVDCYRKFWKDNYSSALGRKGFEAREKNKNKVTRQKSFWL
jgi:hypothetical protein